MAMARKSAASACRSSTITAELCWLMWLTMTTGPRPQARQWIWPAKVFARPRSISTRLLQLDVGRRDDGGPLGDFLLQEGLQLRRRAAAQHAADLLVGLCQLPGLE